MPQVDLRLGASPLFALLAIGAAALLAYLYYRRTLPPISTLRRRILLILRGTVLITLLLLLLEPVIRILSTTTHPPVLTVLIDDSKSLSITDALGARPATVRSVLDAPVFRRIAEYADIRYVAFGVRARAVTPDSLSMLSFSDDGTDIAAAIRSQLASAGPGTSDALVILTDGVFTVGQNPLYGAEGYGTPVFTVGIGDTTEQRDVAITDVSSNAVVYSGIPSPVDVVIKSTGFAGRKVDVTLSDGSTILDRSQVELQEGTREHAVGLSYVPEGEGVRSYTIHVSSLPGELTEKNNRRTFSTRIRKSKLRILILAGAPSPDVAVIRQTLSEVDQFAVQAFTQTPSGTFYEGALRPQLVDSADCLIFLGFPSRATVPAVAEMLFSTAESRRLPLLIQFAKTTDESRLGHWKSILPCAVQGSSSSEVEVTVQPTQVERSMPVLTPGYREGEDPWSALPPVFSLRFTLQVRPDAVIHATARVPGQPSPAPVILSRSVNQQRVLAFALHGIWRWRLMAQRSPSTEKFFSAFLSNAVHWLTAPVESGPVIARPVKDSFAQGEPLGFRAEVYDARQQPVDDAEVRVIVQKGGQTLEGLLLPRGNGRYEGETPGLHTDGEARYRVSASKAGVVSGSDSGRVQVSGTAVEFLNTRLDVDALGRLARSTGGAYLRPESVDRLDSLLTREPSFVPQITTSAREIHFRSWPWYAALIVLLLAAEWVIRKRSGMI